MATTAVQQRGAFSVGEWSTLFYLGTTLTKDDISKVNQGMKPDWRVINKD